MKKAFQIILSVALIFAMGACSEQKKDQSAGLPSTGGGGGVIDSTPVGEVEATGFWVNVPTENQFSVYVNSDDGWGNDCYIAKDDPSTDMICYVDINELDLYTNDIEIQYNAPPDMCTHVGLQTAWHYQFSSGSGPTQIEIEEDKQTGDVQFGSCTATDALGVTDDCDDNVELTNAGTLSTPTCVYDYSSLDGPNCCFGTYRFIYREDENEDGVGDTPAAIDEYRSWGGSSSCMSPYLATGWEFFDKDGYPRGGVIQVPIDDSDSSVGLNDSITLGANAQNYTLGFSYWSNYYHQTAHTHDAYETGVNTRTSTLPYFVDPIDDLDGTPMGSGNEFYSVSCLDSAQEVRHRIRIYIREWNTLSDFLAYEISEGATANPDVTGNEGVACNESGLPIGLCNDYEDFDDILDRAGGSYPTPSGGTYIQRRAYFPGNYYRYE